MRRLYLLLASSALSFLVACGGSSAGGSSTPEITPTTSTAASTSTPAASGTGFKLLALTDDAIIEVTLETGVTSELISLAELGIAAGANRPRIQLIDGLLWVATGPGRLVAVDPVSGAVRTTLEFGSTQVIADFAFRGPLLWVLAGTPNADAIVLAVDRVSGGLVFALDPPPGSPLGALGVAEDGVWVYGGAPPSTTSISQIDPGAGLVARAVDTGLSVSDLLVAGGSVWAGGSRPGQVNVDARLARIDTESGEVVAMIEIGGALRSLAEAAGSIWVTAAGTAASKARLYRIDPATNTVVQQVEIGVAGKGHLDLIAGADVLIAVNSAGGQNYLIDPATGEVVMVVGGPGVPVAVR